MRWFLILSLMVLVGAAENQESLDLEGTLQEAPSPKPPLPLEKDIPADAPENPPEPDEPVSTAPRQSSSPKKKGTFREAAPEAQGTQALDRFNQKEIRKSFYTLNGEALEVDPD